MFLYLGWATVSLGWTSAVQNGFQNVLVIATFLALLLLAEATAAQAPYFSASIEKWINWGTALACVLYGVSLILDQLGTNVLFGARSFGLFAVLGVALQLASWRYRSVRGLIYALAITLLIGMSLSRLALGIAIVLFPLSQIPTRGMGRIFKTATVVLLVGIASYAAFLYVEPLRERFLSGDVSLKIGDVGINVSGRLNFWSVTMDSIMEAPLLGQGAGSTEALIESTFQGIRHPHSDYLRIAHDYGALGLSLWLIAIGSLLKPLWQAWRRADSQESKRAHCYLAALLALSAFCLQMTMENAMVYIFVAAPLGVLVGTALGINRYELAAQRSQRA
jgi:O-antigen ligase